MFRGKLHVLLAVIAVVVLTAATSASAQNPALLQPKYHLPARCFAYVGDASRPATWKLPYRRADGSVDRRRLPWAIEAVLGSYRGRRASIPAAALPDVLQKLARAADEIGRMPPRARRPAPLYRRLAAALARTRPSPKD